MSRRLKHLKELETFVIKTSGTPQTEHAIMSLVDQFVFIYPKYITKGHTKETEIKQIEKKIDITPHEEGLLVKLSIHVSHYTQLYFDLYQYLAKLNSDLSLPPASIKSIHEFSPSINKQIDLPTITVNPEVVNAKGMFL